MASRKIYLCAGLDQAKDAACSDALRAAGHVVHDPRNLTPEEAAGDGGLLMFDAMRWAEIAVLNLPAGAGGDQEASYSAVAGLSLQVVGVVQENEWSNATIHQDLDALLAAVDAWTPP